MVGTEDVLAKGLSEACEVHVVEESSLLEAVNPGGGNLCFLGSLSATI